MRVFGTALHDTVRCVTILSKWKQNQVSVEVRGIDMASGSGMHQGLKAKQVMDVIMKNIGKVIIGREETVKLVLTALLSEGHVLLEDLPGTGKTRLAKALAASLSAEYSRIQFTPDLLPSDVTGLNIYDQSKGIFTLRKGPVFTNILLADEINRATPRTQAGLLECMEEKQVTIDGESILLKEPFFVIATQNPVETSGTFPLPEAQMDRFLLKLSMGLPDPEEELQILKTYMEDDPLIHLQPVATVEQLKELVKQAASVFVHPSVRRYMVELVQKTREQGKIVMGVSPRGTLALLRCIKAYALIEGRSYCIPDDVKKLAVPVLAHRMVLNYGYSGVNEAKQFIESILSELTVPTEDFEK